MAVWPSTLPKPNPDGYEEIMPDNAIRSDMDIGPAKVRKRGTSATTKYVLSFEMDNDGVNTLETFFSTTINDGVDTFDMDDPRNGTTETFRMIGPPKTVAITGTWFRSTVNVEKLT
jgi:hypothetical protein